ncbi:MAG TPA: formate--tetrahydrofolate ligase, partial [bacterium]|nr:formate--tetrahydrofolate ligase [bacterium]
LLEKGCQNLTAHIETVKKSGVRPVVCINSFHTDTKAEVEAVRRIAAEHGAYAAVSDHWLKGGQGAAELAETVVTACNEKNQFRFLYDEATSLTERIHRIATEIYGADDVTYTETARQKVKDIESTSESRSLATCMVKTHLSLSHDPNLKGRPKGWVLPIQDILVYRGAGFVVPVAGDIKLMPGTSSDPAFRKIDVDLDTGTVTGLF